jgi:CRISPR-associated protein Cas1
MDEGVRDALQSVQRQLSHAARRSLAARDVAELRGIEGDCARLYFSAFNGLIRHSDAAFAFTVRSRRPPLDRVNALLSFLYAMLGHDCRSALEAVGLDPQVGLLHADKPGRTSLALDLMEEMRPVLADRLALSLINRRQVAASDFVVEDGGGVRMSDDARKTVLVAWQERKKEELRHPFLGEALSLGLVVHVQAQLLARHLRGDLDGYPPFIWK